MKTTKKYGFNVADGYVDCGFMSLKLEILEMDREKMLSYVCGEILISVGAGKFRETVNRMFDYLNCWFRYQKAKSGNK